jgi:transposase
MKLLVPDALWERLEPLLPPPPQRRFRFPGRKPLDYRRILTGILFVLKTGIAWEDLPAELGCGCGKTCREYLKRWHEAGVWTRLHAVLLAELNEADQIDWERGLIDASFAKAPEGGEDTGPNPTDRGKSGSKHHVLTDAQGIPLAATVTAANVNEVTQVFDVLTGMSPVGGKSGPPRENRSGCKAIPATTPSRSGSCCGGWGSRRSWASGGASTAAAWACLAGSWNGRSLGCIAMVGCAVGWIGLPNSKMPSSSWPVTSFV